MRTSHYLLALVVSALSFCLASSGCVRRSGSPRERERSATMASTDPADGPEARPKARPEAHMAPRRARPVEARDPSRVSPAAVATNVRAPVADQKRVVADATLFALALYARLRSRQGNIFLSPWSISTALGMTYAGARGRTATELARALRFSLPQSRIHRALGTVQSLLEPGKGEVLAIANRIYPQSGLAILPPFLGTLKRAYGSTVRPLDFKENGEASRKTINTWVQRRTRGHIRDLLHSTDINKKTRMVLVNAIYFKGRWASPFDKRFTRPAPFRRSSGKTVKVPMMHKTSRFRYGALGGAKLLELPYQSGRLAMVVLLPNKPAGLSNLERTLTAQKLTRAITGLQKRKVSVYLPRFELASRFDLKKQLRGLGAKLPFTNKANFRGMTTQEPLKISKVIHQANCDVAEEGTTAAAATAVVMARGTGMPSPPTVFRADHPFLFLIRDRRTGAILFLGRMADPTS